MKSFPGASLSVATAIVTSSLGIGAASAQKAGGAEAPIYTLTLAGTELQFFSVPGEGDGAVMQIARQDTPDLVGQPGLEGATPAEIFCALTVVGTPVPEGLLANQRYSDRPGFTCTRERQGWAINRSQTAPRAACDNQSLYNAHAQPTIPGYQPGDWDSWPSFGYLVDTHGSASWSTNATRRYRAAFCVSAGSIRERLVYYKHHDNQCVTYHEPTVVWGSGINGSQGELFSAGAALKYVWLAGSSSRQYYNTVSATSATYDFVARAKTSDCF